MKNCTLIGILFLLTIGCNKPNNQKLHDLTDENKKLRNEIEVLKDSLSDFEEDFLHSQILIGVADETVLKVGKKNNVVMLFQTYNRKLPDYEIYKIEDNKKIKVGSDNKTRFNINFTPKSLQDKTLKLEVKMRYKDKTINIPAEVYFDLKQ